MSSRTEEARKRAAQLDVRLEADLEKLSLPGPEEFFREVRLYLDERSRRLQLKQNIVQLVHKRASGDEFVIELGPAFDKGDTETHFHFPSGARLSFGITLRKQGSAALTVAYRFCLRLPASSGTECFIFNLNREPHPDPVQEPRFHVHPGFPHFRIPVPALSPLDVLDRIFFVIEPAFSR